MSFMKPGFVALAMAVGATSVVAQHPAPTSEEQSAIDRARQALETRHEWADDLTVQSIKPTDWPDSSLGCRKPGVSYMQVITPGYTVRFAGKNAHREVHVAGSRTAICTTIVGGMLKNPTSRVPLRALNDMIEKARADLATRLGGKVTEVTLAGWVPVELPARVLRCEVVNGDAGEPVVPGYRIVLVYKARDYTYQSDTQTVTACPRIEAN